MAMTMQLRSRFGLLAAVAALYLCAPAHADVVIFKDGFMLYGKISRDGETITDPGGQAFQIPSGPFFMLDGARRVYFSHAHVAGQQQECLRKCRAG